MCWHIIVNCISCDRDYSEGSIQAEKKLDKSPVSITFVIVVILAPWISFFLARLLTESGSTRVAKKCSAWYWVIESGEYIRISPLNLILTKFISNCFRWRKTCTLKILVLSLLLTTRRILSARVCCQLFHLVGNQKAACVFSRVGIPNLIAQRSHTTRKYT